LIHYGLSIVSGLSSRKRPPLLDILGGLLERDWSQDSFHSNDTVGVIWCFATHPFAYRIYSNKRRGAYLIFRVTGAALIRGWRLFEGGAYLISLLQNFLK